MSDIKLFRIGEASASEIPGKSFLVEKSLQKLFEKHLNALLGVRFLKTEHSTGITHGGRIDTLGIDENGFPVIIEYKRSSNENVITQGLYYLDWLLDHKGDFEVLVSKQLGGESAKEIDWSQPRLLCIASSFNKFDLLAVKQINRNVELICYSHHGDDLLMLKLLTKTSASPAPPTSVTQTPIAEIGDSVAAHNSIAERYISQSISHRLAQSPQYIKDLFGTLRSYLLSLGDDVSDKQLKYYHAFRRLKNFACVEVSPQAERVFAYLKVDPDTVPLEPPFTRDVRNVGHFGTGDLEVSLKTMADFEKAQPLFVRSYEAS